MTFKKITLAAAALVFAAAALTQAGGRPGGAHAKQTPSKFMIYNTAAKLNAEEIAELKALWEEERAAYDLYRAFFDKYNKQVFDHISGSELRHKAAFERLMDRYGIAYSKGPFTPGVYENAEIQALYNKLKAQGDQNLEQALRAAALVEETDLRDLEAARETFRQKPARMTLENLRRATRNHLRAFVRNLKALGAEYAPVLLAQEEYDRIIAQGHEPGPRGKGRRKGRGASGGGAKQGCDGGDGGRNHSRNHKSPGDCRGR